MIFDYAAYAQSLREEIHMYPEIGFDLPKTLAVVHRELDKMGIPYTGKFGRSSVVATINEEKKGFTIGLRADMDALPIQEANEIACKSRHDGIMHACGHDVHTAVLLASAKWLTDHREQIDCRVKLLFTPAEEYVIPGCKELAENGVMDDIDCAVAIHVDPDLYVGTVASAVGDSHSNSMGFKARFYGTTAHAANQNRGKDAIMMAVEAITAMEIMAAKEFPPAEPRLLNIGSIHGGNTNNIICDYVEIFGSCRAYSDEVTACLEQRLRQITEGTAAMAGGRGEFEVTKLLPYVVNNEHVAMQLHRTADRVLGEGRIISMKRKLGGEDFGFLSRRKPCAQFRIGVKPLNAEGRIPPLHNDRFDIDNGCFETGIRMFTGFVMDAMHGIEGL
ncbi:MAG: amidohydrolase [Oscillospiraceae bacterium]|nr:amidohydrolase [Oscillospiraceae bacterium]